MTHSTADPKNLQRIRLVIADHQTLVRDLLRVALSSDAAYEVVADSATAQCAIAMCAKLKPDLVLLDMQLPDHGAIRAVAEIARVSPRTRVLLCAGTPSEDRLLDFIHSRADGFADKTGTLKSLLEAVRRVAGGERFLSVSATPAAASQMKRPQRAIADRWSLTRREAQVLKLVAEGASNKKIAAIAGITTHTVEVHRRNLMKKLGVRNAAGLTAYAFESGVMSLRTSRTDAAPDQTSDGPLESL